MKKTYPLAKKGAMLLTLIVTLTALGVLGGAIVYIFSTGVQSRVMYGYASRSYYLAESGAEFVRALRELDDTLYPVATYTLNNGDQFHVDTTATSNGVVVVSTGIALPGSLSESRRRITFIIDDPITEGTLPIGFDFSGDGDFDDDLWDVDGGLRPKVKTTGTGGPSGGEEALDLQGTEGGIDLNWQDNPDLDLVSIWNSNSQFLSYEVQMKIAPFDTGNQEAYSHHYMLGVSFRNYPDVPTTYGMSFFRSRRVRQNGQDDSGPSWLPPSFDALRGTNVHLVAWYKNPANSIQLLNSRVLTPADGVVFQDEGYNELKGFSTILVKLDEQLNASGNRENHISGYVQGTGVYPNWDGPEDQRWSEDSNIFPTPVTWDNPSVQEIIDTRITSENFGIDRPSEFGIHVFYDQSGASKKFFDDFAVLIDGFGGDDSGGSQTQF